MLIFINKEEQIMESTFRTYIISSKSCHSGLTTQLNKINAQRFADNNGLELIKECDNNCENCNRNIYSWCNNIKGDLNANS